MRMYRALMIKFGALLQEIRALLIEIRALEWYIELFGHLVGVD